MGTKVKAALFFLMLCGAASASEIKALVGPNWNKYLFSGEITYMNRRQKTGFGLGVGWALPLNRNMKLEVDALFSAKGAKTSLEYSPGKMLPGIYKNASLALPFLFRYQLKEGATPYAALGPEIVFILAHHLWLPESEENFNIADNTRKIVLAYNLLLGYEWPIGEWSLFAEIRYDRWLGNFWTDPQASAKSESVAFLLGGAYRL